MDRHFVLTLGRSGSNTLRNLLNQNPQVLNFGEVLGEWNRIRQIQMKLGLFKNDHAAYLDWILYGRLVMPASNLARSAIRLARRNVGDIKRYGQLRTIGVKDFSMNLTRFGIEDYLEARPDIKVIGLIREDIIDRMISNAMLGATGIVKIGPDDTGSGPGQLTIDPGQILTDLTAIENENEILDRILKALPADRVYVLKYEDFFSSTETRQRCMREIFDFLGVAYAETAPLMRKIIRTPPAETIRNIEDCRAALRGSRFEGLL